MLNRQIPVLNKYGTQIGTASGSNGWKQASKLIGVSAMYANRYVDGKRTDCWVPGVSGVVVK